MSTPNSKLCVLILLLSSLCNPASAHPLAPALLQLQETTPAHYEVLWRTSVTRTQQQDVSPQLPLDCIATSEPQITTEDGDAVVARWSVRCDTALTGRHIAVQGLAQSGINVIVHLLAREGVIDTLLSPDQPGFEVPRPEAQPPVFVAYLQLGIEHLLTGLDHLLFVAGLLLLVRRVRPLLLTITAFTLGHSLTLALASLGLIHVHQPLAELGIAISILVLAVEISRPAESPTSTLVRWPWLMAGAFGLLHGLGFAAALVDVGLPQGQILLALLAFNIGIELGQLLVVSLLLAAAWLWQQQWKTSLKTGSRAGPAYLIGTLAAYWCWDRLASLWV